MSCLLSAFSVRPRRYGSIERSDRTGVVSCTVVLFSVAGGCASPMIPKPPGLAVPAVGALWRGDPWLASTPCARWPLGRDRNRRLRFHPANVPDDAASQG